MAVHGTIAAEHISGEGLREPSVCELVRRTHVIEGAQHEERSPFGCWADVTVTLKDGKRFESAATHACGGPEHPFYETEICEKFKAYAAPVIGAVCAKDPNCWPTTKLLNDYMMMRPMSQFSWQELGRALRFCHENPHRIPPHRHPS